MVAFFHHKNCISSVKNGRKLPLRWENFRGVRRLAPWIQACQTKTTNFATNFNFAMKNRMIKLLLLSSIFPLGVNCTCTCTCMHGCLKKTPYHRWLQPDSDFFQIRCAFPLKHAPRLVMRTHKSTKPWSRLNSEHSKEDSVEKWHKCVMYT